jgi:hypothetical protein
MPRFSRLTAGLHVGADFFERAHALGPADATPAGLVDDVADLAHDGIDIDRLQPAVRHFLERTGDLDLRVRSRWRPWFRPVWRVLRPLFGAVGQLYLPLREATIRTRLLAIDEARDGRAGARGVIREYADTGRPMQVLAYAIHDAADGRYMSAALPLPLGNLAGLLRLEAIDRDEGGRIDVALTSRAPSGGIWFATRLLALRLPLQERLSLWVPRTPGAPPDLDPAVVDRCVLVGRHEQRLFGALVVTHDYWFYPRA